MRVTDLDDVIRVLRLDASHDYQRAETDGEKTVAIRWLGILGSTLDRIKVALPHLEVIERRREPAVGHPGDWVRCDLVLRNR